MLPPRDEQPGLRIELEELRAPLLDEMIGHHEHRFFRQTKAAHFHSGGGHGPGLARSHDVRQQRAAALHDPPHRIFLMAGQVSVAQIFAIHAGQLQMRAVEGAQAQIVEAVVIFAGEPRRPRAVFPYPLPESIL